MKTEIKTSELLDALASEHKPVCSLARPVRRWLNWSLFAAVYVGIGLALFRPEELSIRAPHWLLLMGAATAAYQALLLNAPGVCASVVTRVVTFLSLGSWAAIQIVEMLRHSTYDVFGAPRTCALEILGLAVVPAVVTFFWLRQGVSLKRETTGFFALLSSGSLGAWLLSFACPNDDTSHLFVAHGLTITALGILGRTIGQRALVKI